MTSLWEVAFSSHDARHLGAKPDTLRPNMRWWCKVVGIERKNSSGTYHHALIGRDVTLLHRICAPSLRAASRNRVASPSVSIAFAPSTRANGNLSIHFSSTWTNRIGLVQVFGVTECKRCGRPRSVYPLWRAPRWEHHQRTN
jgi:hypothetical protein